MARVVSQFDKKFAVCNVNTDIAGLKLTNWVRKNICKDWRRIQKLYQKQQIWVVNPENSTGSTHSGSVNP